MTLLAWAAVWAVFWGGLGYALAGPGDSAMGLWLGALLGPLGLILVVLLRFAPRSEQTSSGPAPEWADAYDPDARLTFGDRIRMTWTWIRGR